MLAMPTIRGAIAAAMVAFVSLVALAPAEAAVIVGGRWDPRYGEPFTGTPSSDATDMFWAGEAKFYFSDGCGLSAGYTGTVSASLACDMKVQDAKVFLAEGSVNAADEIYFATLNFGADTAGIYEARFVNGKLMGLKSDFFDPWVSTSETLYNVDDFDFTLAFYDDGVVDGVSKTGPLLYHASKAEFVGKHDHGHDDLEHFWQGNGYGHLTAACPNTDINSDGFYCGYSDNYGNLDVDPILDVVVDPRAIPEPETHALMLVGLAALGFSARRRRQRAVS